MEESIMKRHHKWFRKERYKQKLERSVDKHHTYFSNVYFTTEEPDPKDLRENILLISWAADLHGISIEEATERYIEREKKWGNGRFIYYDRPEVPYSIRYYYKKKGRSDHQTFLKNQTARRVRQRWKQYGEVYQHNEYRKTTEFWWDLD
jgi:hypothetical protein